MPIPPLALLPHSTRSLTHAMVIARPGCTDSFSDWTSRETIGIGEELSMDQRDRFWETPKSENPFVFFSINCRGPEHFPVNINSGEYVNHGWLGVLLFLSVRSQKKRFWNHWGSSHPSKIDKILKNWRYSGKKKGSRWLYPYGDGSKPYPPGEHQNSW